MHRITARLNQYLLNVRKLRRVKCVQAEAGHVGTGDRASLAINHVDNAVGRIESEATRAHNAVLKVRTRTLEEEALLVVLVREDALGLGLG